MTISTEWKNYGDVNPLEHGGIFVWQESETTFRIVKVFRICQAGKEIYSIQDLFVDISDTWIDMEAVERYEGSVSDPVRFAIACTDYYSAGNFGCDIESYFTHEEVIKELEAYRINV